MKNRCCRGAASCMSHILKNESGHFCLFFFFLQGKTKVYYTWSFLWLSTNCLVGENNNMSLGLHIYSQWHIQLCHFRYSMQTSYSEMWVMKCCGLTYTLHVVSLHKINKLVYFAAPLNTRQAYDLRQSFHKSFYSVAGRVARSNFAALAGDGVNAQLDYYVYLEVN